MIFANVRAVFVRAFIIKSALLETGHVSRSQTVCLVSKRYRVTVSSLILRLSAKKCAFCTSGVKLTPVMILILKLFLLYFFKTFVYLAHDK